MAYLLTAQVHCQKFSFWESNGELVEHVHGRLTGGIIGIHHHDDGLRITLGDTINVTKAIIKDAFAAFSRKPSKIFKRYISDDLNHFDFTEHELNTGKKLIKIQGRVVNGTMAYMLLCYDFTIWEGRVYYFSDFDEIKKWAEILNIAEYEIADLKSGAILDIEMF